MESAPLIKSLPIPDTLHLKKKGGEKSDTKVKNIIRNAIHRIL